MNVYEWMGATESEPPMHEDDSREDPTHRPQVPHEDDDNRQHHGDNSPAGGGRVQSETEHQTDRVIQDPEMMTDLTASNESIIEDIRKFFKMHNRGSKFEEMDGNARAGAAKILKSIGDTFANKQWLDKQTPITHKIKVGDLTDRLNLDQMAATIKETYAINASFQNAMQTAQQQVLKQMLPVMKQWGADKITDKVYEATKAMLKEVKPLSEVIKKPTRLKTNLLPGEATAEGRDPMSPEEVLEVATIILNSMKEDSQQIETNSEWIYGELEGFLDAEYEIERNDGHSESYNLEAWMDLCAAVYRKISIDTVPEMMAAFRQFEGACVAAVIYMERSFKGGKGVAVEDFTIANEGFLDAIKSLFKQKPKDVEVKGLDNNVIKQLEDTLLNDSWLKEQTLTTGTVEVRFPDAAQDGNYKPLVGRIQQELDKAAKINAAASNKWLNYIKVGVDLIISGNLKNANLEQVQKLNEFIVYDDIDFGRQDIEPNNITEDNAEVELPALDEKGIKEATKTIIQLIEMRNQYGRKSFGNVPTYVPSKRKEMIENLEDDDLREALTTLCSEVDDILGYFVEGFYQHQYNYFYMVEGLAKPLMHWIQKSITGIKYGNEAFADVGKR